MLTGRRARVKPVEPLHQSFSSKRRLHCNPAQLPDRRHKHAKGLNMEIQQACEMFHLWSHSFQHLCHPGVTPEARAWRERCSNGQIRSVILGVAGGFCFCAMPLNHHFDKSVTLQLEDEQGRLTEMLSRECNEVFWAPMWWVMERACVNQRRGAICG